MTDDDAVIRSLIAHFADAINRRDRVAFAKLWWEDGVWTLTEPYAMTASGITELLAMYDRLMAGWEFFVQCVHSGVIETALGNSRARFTMREVARAKNAGRSYENLAIYDDTIERRDGIWRFAKRRYCYVWVDDTAITGQAYPLPADLQGARTA